MNESSMMMPWRSFRDTFCALAVVVVSAGSVACSSDSGSSSSSSSSGSTAPANLRIFPAKIYSGFDGQNKYRVPAVVVGSASEATWSISDPALASLEPSIDGVILTTKKAGTAKLTVKISGVTATAEVTVNAYTPVYTPDDFYLVTGSLGYSWRLKDGRELRANLVINNLLNDRGPIYSQSTAVRPKGGDYTSPARETVADGYGLKQPISYNLTLTLRL